MQISRSKRNVYKEIQMQLDKYNKSTITHREETAEAEGVSRDFPETVMSTKCFEH